MDDPSFSQIPLNPPKEDPCVIQRSALIQLWHDIQNKEDALSVDPHTAARLLGFILPCDPTFQSHKKDDDEVWTENYIYEKVFNFKVEFNNLRCYLYECPYKCAEILIKAATSGRWMKNITEDERSTILAQGEIYILNSKEKYQKYFGGETAVHLAECYLCDKLFAFEQICRIQNLYHELMFGHRNTKALHQFIAIQDDLEVWTHNSKDSYHIMAVPRVQEKSIGQSVTWYIRNEVQKT